MLRAAGKSERFCHACFSGRYPVPSRRHREVAPRLPDGSEQSMSDGLGQLVYFFGQGRADGTAAMKDILGGKGPASPR
jgi:hypothetical protein